MGKTCGKLIKGAYCDTCRRKGKLRHLFFTYTQRIYCRECNKYN